MKYSIGFYCKSIPFTNQTIELQTSLGGSESALIYMARALAQQGHRVSVFTEIDEQSHRGEYRGVQWYDFSEMQAVCEGTEWDVFISLRFFDIMHQSIRAKCRVIWNQDILMAWLQNKYLAALWQVDRLFMVSEWQKRQYCELISAIEKLCFVTRNGIDLTTVQSACAVQQKIPNKLIYISRPERGLKPLLQIFSRMRQNRSNLQLYVARYYSMYELDPGMQQVCAEADALVSATEGAFFLGHLDKQELYGEIASSMLMLYPGVPNFDETSCIAAIEAQACKTPLICTACGGLVETLHDDAGVKMDSRLVDAPNSPYKYFEHAVNPANEYTSNRFELVLQMLGEISPRGILDFACGNGSMTVKLANRFPEAEVVGIDYAPDCLKMAQQFALKQSKYPERICFLHGSLSTISGKFDLIFAGEILEHFANPVQAINALEEHTAESGILCFTVPSGPLVEESQDPEFRPHRIHFEENTLIELFGAKTDLKICYLSMGKTRRGSPMGHWIVRYRKSEVPTGDIDWNKKITLIRPYESLSVCMITRNNEDDIGRCLKSVKDIADEIIIADTGSTDDTLKIASRFTDTILKIGTCPDYPNAPPPGSFEWARNKSIEPASGDWILWIDTDEKLIHPENLGKYLISDTVFEGYGIRQNHLMLDGSNNYNTPVRLFRNGRGYRFWGVIHEHAYKSLNEPIAPSFLLPDVDIAHFGYVTEGERRRKGMERNLKLLALDRQKYPDRQLGLSLLARDYLNMVHWEVETYGRVTPTAQQHLWNIVTIWREHFSHPEHPLFEVVFPIYQDALGHLNMGRPMRIDISFAENAANPQILRFEQFDDLTQYLKFRQNQLMKGY